jgi:hypothetical protein
MRGVQVALQQVVWRRLLRRHAAQHRTGHLVVLQLLLLLVLQLLLWLWLLLLRRLRQCICCSKS